MNEETRRILVVDDEPSMRITLVANLELEGFEVYEAANAKEALDVLARNRCDLVLSDVRMPGQSGVDLSFELAKRHPTLAIVLMTAFANEDELRRSIGSGVYTVLPKPFDIDVLLRVLARALQRPAVLFIDESANAAAETTKAMRSSGLRVVAESDVDTAVARVREGSVDVCVTELRLVDADVVTVLERIRAIDPSLTVIVCSRHDAPELVRRALSKGAYTCVRKPIRSPDLAWTIARARCDAAAKS